MSPEIPNTLPELTEALIRLRKKPTTEERFKQYPAMLQRFRELSESCEDAPTLLTVLKLDTGYYLPAFYRQRVIEKLLEMHRTPNLLRVYAQQLELFGDVDEFGEEDLNIDKRVDALYAEADVMEKSQRI